MLWGVVAFKDIAMIASSVASSPADSPAIRPDRKTKTLSQLRSSSFSVEYHSTVCPLSACSRRIA